jgi:hypothetical protein
VIRSLQRGPPGSPVAIRATAKEPLSNFKMVLLQENHILPGSISRNLSVFCPSHVNNISDIWDIPRVVLGGEIYLLN